MIEAMQKPPTSFDWAIYADATFAGLSMLIPVPLLDLLFEQIFRRRMPQAIARRRGQRLSPAVLQVLNRWGCSWAPCSLLPFWLLFQLGKRLSKKILYFLSVKEAVDTLSYYWHRAFLLDYTLQAGHLVNPASAGLARQAMDEILANPQISPLHQLASQVIAQSRHVLQTLWRVVRRGREDETIAQDKQTMRAAWRDVSAYLDDVALGYQTTYERLQAASLGD